MKANKWIVFVFIAILLATLIMTAKPATAIIPDNSVSEDVTPTAAPATTDWIPDQKVSATTLDEMRPSIATAGDGSLWVAYQQYNSVSSKYDIVVSKSTDGGVTWTVKFTDSSNYNFYAPSIAIDPYYNYVYVAFEIEWSATNHNIELLWYNGTNWLERTVDYSSVYEDYNPSIVCEYNYGAANNFVFVAWERHVNSQDTELMFAKSTDHGATWGLKYALTSHGTGELTDQPTMAYTYNGTAHLYIAYRDYNYTTGFYGIGLLTSTYEGSSFGAPQFISPHDTVAQREPSIAAIHGAGVVVVAFVAAPSPSINFDDIWYVYSINNGTNWNFPIAMATSTSNEISPQLTVDGMGGQGTYLGNIHATYEVIETVGSRVNGMYYRTANYATPTTWSAAVQVADDNAYVSQGYSNVADRAITTVHNTVPVIVWTDLRNPSYDIFATTLGGKYTINTSPAGLQVSVDGTFYTSPQSVYWAYMSVHTLSVTSPQGPYSFLSWSDGGSQSHSATANTLGEQTITANFKAFNLKETASWYWTSHTVISSVARGDVDGDGSVEIVTGGWYYDGTRNVAQLCVWNGATLALENVRTWYWGSGTYISSVAIGNVDGDSQMEIVTGGNYYDGTRDIAQLVVWNGATLALENLRTWYWTSHTNINSVALGDVDNDGNAEIVTGGNYYDGTRNVAQLIVWNGANLALENIKTWYWTSDTVISSVAIGNVDGDSQMEIVTGGWYYDGTRNVAQLIVWNGANLAVENLKTWYWGSGTYISSVAIGNVDGDSQMEIVTGGNYYDGTRDIAQLVVWNGATLALENLRTWYWTSHTNINSVALGDVDNDGNAEIVTGGNYYDGTRNVAQLIVWNGANLALENIKTWYWTSNTVINSVVVGDVDSDAQTEVVTGGYYNDGTRNNAQLAVWGMV